MTQPTGEPGTLGRLARHLVEAVQPLADAFSDADAFKALMLQLGWEVQNLPPSYAAVADKVTPAVTALERLTDGATIEEVLAAVSRAGDVYRAVGALTDAPAGVDPSVFLSELARRVLEYLLGRQLLTEAPDWYAALEALRIVAHEDHPPAGGRPGFVRVRFDWDQIPALLADLPGVPARVYGWGTRDLATDRILELLAEVIGGLRLPVSLDLLAATDVDSLLADATEPPDETANVGMTLVLGDIALPDGRVETVGLRLTGLPADGDALPGLILLPQVPDGINAAVPLGKSWTLTVRAGTDVSQQLAVFARPGDVGVRYPGAPGQQLPSAGFGVSLAFAPDAPLALFGQPGQTRLELAGMKIAAAVDLRAGVPEVSFTASVDGLALVISPAGADGFLGTVLGDQEIRVTIPAEFRWSSRTGLQFASGAGLELTIATNLDLSLVRVDSVTLAVAAHAGTGTTPALVTRAAASFSGSLGPISYVVDRFGVELPVTFAPGNAGPFDVGLRVAPPTGAGLSVDVGVVAGGGFLSFDPERGQYAGALELEFADLVQLKAIGLISTRMPDGSSGFSLLAIITAEFGSGIQLGLGFTLLAVGGLLGLNRGMNLQALTEGVRTGAIESVMFPQDVVANVPRILSDLNAFFPPEQGTFLIGPMAKIGWGTPPLVTVSLGLIIEIPGNIAVLGVLRAILPSPQLPLLVIQVDFAGALEPDKNRLWFVARLFDSSVLGLPLDGGMGLLVAWGDNQDLIMTVGGFHPSYRTPQLPFDVPGRLAVDLLHEGGQLIRLSGYFAITSNTIQFGGELYLKLGFGGFGIEGYLTVDALFQRSPFRFTGSSRGSVSLKAFGVGLFHIDLRFQLEGPAPYHAKGRGSIGFLFFEISADFDITWSDPITTTLPPILVLPLLAGEIVKPEGWQTHLPTGSGKTLVNLRQLPATDALVLHPLGTLTIRQRALPLNVRVDQVGGQRAADGKQFSVAPAAGSGLRLLSVPGEKFAMGQYQNLSDADRLSRPGYETQDAGLELTGAGNALATARVVRRSARYELHVVDTGVPATARVARARTALAAGSSTGLVKRFHDINPAVFDQLLRGSSTSSATLSRREAALRQPFAAGDTVTVDNQRFVVAYLRSNIQAFPPATFRSQTAAADALAGFVANDTTLAGRLHVIPAAEAAIPPAVPDTWTDAGTLPVPVSDVDAVPLGSGRVLVAGGTATGAPGTATGATGTAAGGTATAGTALFDPTGNSWSAGPPMSTARELHTTTPLRDGRVLVAGGRGTGGAPLASAEVYDPAANAWSAVPVPLATARYGHTATVLPDGRVLVAGGTGAHGGALAGAELYHPATGAWTPAAPMLDARTGHRAVPLDDTRVLVVGGALPTGEPGEPGPGGAAGAAGALAYCEVYDATTGTWTATGSLATPRKGHQATPLGNGRVLVTGGDAVTAPDGSYDPHSLATAELYDPATGTWAPAAAMPGGRSGHRGLLTRAGTVLVLGGTGGPGHTAGFRYVAAYDPAADRWTTRAGLRTGRSAFGVVELADTRVLVAGGTAAAGPAAPGPAASAPASNAEALIP